jgi:hypothetical protein
VILRCPRSNNFSGQALVLDVQLTDAADPHLADIRRKPVSHVGGLRLLSSGKLLCAKFVGLPLGRREQLAEPTGLFAVTAAARFVFQRRAKELLFSCQALPPEILIYLTEPLKCLSALLVSPL